MSLLEYRSIGPSLHRLPRLLTPFVGRDKEVFEVTTRLTTTPLVTLTGTGGVGKTRLAIRVAEELAEDFADGAWFVDLALCPIHHWCRRP